MSLNKLNILIIGSTFSIKGGVQNYIFNLISNFDLQSFNITYVASMKNPNEETYLNQYTNLGVECITLDGSSFQRWKNYGRFLKKNKKYHIAHIHLTSGAYVIYGILTKLITNTKVVFHSHTYKPVLKISIRQKIVQTLYNFFGDFFLACSRPAGEYMFGKKIISSSKYFTAKNGINKNIFHFNERARIKLRSDLNIDNNVVYGYVGRIDKEKNLYLLIEVFKKIYQKQLNSSLVIVGDGPLLSEIKNLVNQLNLSKQVIFVGSKKNINEYMSAFDLLLLTSHFESLGIVLIEAQACGLNCLVSSNVLDDSKLTPIWHQMSKDSNADEWALEAMRFANNNHSDYWPYLNKAGYSVESSKSRIQDLYLHLMNSLDY